MPTLAEVKRLAALRFAGGDAATALRLYDAAVAAAPLDFEARLRLADALAALGRAPLAVEVYRAVGWYCIKAGHPLASIVAARVIESLAGADAADDLVVGLVAHYGKDSALVGSFAGRINLPAGTREIAVPDLAAAPPPGALEATAARARDATASFDEWPAALHPIPILSQLSEASFRRVVATLVVRRLPDGATVVRAGDPGESFFMVATGWVRVFDTDAEGRQALRARLAENAVFGEMALLTARSRSASVAADGEVDLLEATRHSLASIATELDQVATALSAFTRERLLSSMVASSPLFRPFTQPQRRDLLRRFTTHDVAPGTPIIRQGDEGRGLFIVLAGEVDVTAADAEGRSTPLATLRAGDIFGELSILRGGLTMASVTAASAGTVLFLAREYVDRIVAGVPEIRDYLAALADDRALEIQLATDVDMADTVEDEVQIFI